MDQVWPQAAIDHTDAPLGEFRGAQETGSYQFLAWEGERPVGLIDRGTFDKWVTWKVGLVAQGCLRSSTSTQPPWLSSSLLVLLDYAGTSAVNGMLRINSMMANFVEREPREQGNVEEFVLLSNSSTHPSIRRQHVQQLGKSFSIRADCCG